MNYTGPIDLDALVDLDSLASGDVCHYTFFAFPISSLNEYRLPSDPDAQHYIAAVQSAGVSVGIWLNSPAGKTGYAAVTHDEIPVLNNAIANLKQFSELYAIELSEKLFREVASGNG